MTTAALTRLLAAPPDADADLLAAFAAHHDQAAFAELARRHGPMVRAVARRATRDTHLADDVAQAVFLVLARKANRLARPDRLAGWLFGVTRRIARKAAVRHARTAARPLPEVPAAESRAWDDLPRVLDEELACLPDAERVALVLCYLEGLTQDEAARSCGWGVRTLRRRVAAGRERLRERLERRGVELGAVLIAVAVGRASACDTLAPATARAVGLARGELRAGAWWAAGVAVVGLVAGLAAGGRPDAPLPAAPQPAKPEAVVHLGSGDMRHPTTLTDLRFSPDGREVVSYGHGVTRRWDAKSGKLLASPPDFPTTTNNTFPVGDGTAAVGIQYGPQPFHSVIRRYDLTTGRHEDIITPPKRMKTDLRYVLRAVPSPDGSLCAVNAPDGKGMTIWDLQTRKAAPDAVVPPGNDHVFLFTPDNKHFVTAGGSGRTIRFWDTQTGKEARTLTRTGGKLPQSSLNHVAFSADGKWVAAIDNTGLHEYGTEVTVWDTARPDAPRVIVADIGGGRNVLLFGAGTSLFLVSGTQITRWDAATGERVAKWDGPWHGELPAVSPDGSTFAVGTSNGVIQVYDAKTGRDIAPLGGHMAQIIVAKFDPTGGEIRTVASDLSSVSWDARTGTARVVGGPPPDKFGYLSPDGRWVVSQKHLPNQGGKYEATIWDAVTHKQGPTWPQTWYVTPVASIPGTDLLVVYGDAKGGKQLHTWNTSTGATLPAIDRVFDQNRTVFTATADGETLVMCDQDTVTGYELRTGKERFRWKLAGADVLGAAPKGESNSVGSIAASPDGKTLAVSVYGPPFAGPANRTESLVAVEIDTGKVIRRVPTPETSSRWLVFSPDGKRLAGSQCVWDFATLKEVRRFPKRPWVTAAGFSPDGTRVVTGHANGTAAVWSEK